MFDPMASMIAALICWFLAGVALRIGWDATFRPDRMWIARTCCALIVALLLMVIALTVFGLAGFLRGA